jgi:DNA-binding SARP family transcriptional activator
MDVDFRLLGPLDIRHRDCRLDPGTPKQRTVLALLLIEVGQSVSAERLVDELWPAGAPRSAVANVSTYVSRLRKLLNPAACEIRSHGSAYVLDVPPGSIDLWRFARLADEGDAAWADGDLAGAAARWGRAGELWFGTAFEGLPRGPTLAAAHAEWEERRFNVADRHAGARLWSGQQTGLVAELRRRTAAAPLRESGWLLLIGALYLEGNRAAALDAYQRVRVTLAEQLGVDPAQELRDVHLAVLRGATGEVRKLIHAATLDALPTVREPTTGPAVAPPGQPVPAQLPLDVYGFTGRTPELHRLDAALARASQQPTAVVVIAISGMAGVGKTALAVHWAHRVTDRFPDGQLYLNLRGFDPDDAAVEPTDAIRQFLFALGVPASDVPNDPQARIWLYRSVLAGRRLLIVLDNARNEDQLRPLLPGSPGSVVVVTSRNELTGLIAVEGAQSTVLDPLTRADARELLVRRLDPRPAPDDDQALDDIVHACARLPLALVIVAARAVSRRRIELASIVTQLHSATGRLDALAGADTAADLRSVFSWSYRALGADAARLFRLLALYPGPDVSTATAASLAGLPPARADALLAGLTAAHLLTEHLPGRYTQHDLLRAYATELAAGTDQAGEMNAATLRILDHYVHTAHAAALGVEPQRPPLRLDRPVDGVTPELTTDLAAAMDWFDAEHAALLALVDGYAGGGHDTRIWQLAWAPCDYFYRRGRWHDWAFVQQVALSAARRAGDRSGQANAYRDLGMAYGYLERDDDAHEHFQQALDIFQQLGDLTSVAQIHHSAGWLLGRQARYPEAIERARQAFDLSCAAGDDRAQAYALNNLGWYRAQLGDLVGALGCCEKALATHSEKDHGGRASALDSLGYIYHRLGHHKQAAASYREALDLRRMLGERYNEATTLNQLGDAELACDNPDAARDSWALALTILDQLAHPDAYPLRHKLAGGLLAAHEDRVGKGAPFR